MSGEWDGLRAAAEAVELEADWYEPNAYIDTRNPQDVGFIAAASPDVVLGLLDRLQAAEAAVERVRAVVSELRRPDLSLVGRIMSPSLRTIADALEGHESGVTGSLGPPQAEVALGSSLGPEGTQGASGAESDHGGRGDGEGLG